VRCPYRRWRTADHPLDDLRIAGVARRHLRHHAPGAHHRHTVGTGAHVGQLVADQHDRQASRRQASHQGPQALGFEWREHRARLVEHHAARVAQQDLGELNQLHLANRQMRHPRVGVDAGRQCPQVHVDRRQP